MRLIEVAVGGLLAGDQLGVGDGADDVPGLVQPVERAVADRQLAQLEIGDGPEGAVAVA